MSDISPQLKASLLKVIRDDYQRCEFLTAVAQLLTHKINAIAEDVEHDRISFSALRDTIGDIGMAISTVEKRLEQAEECYSRLIDVLAEHRPDAAGPGA